MTVYVDDMYLHPMGNFRGMKMSHMIADTTEELLEMADKIGVQRKWIQQAEMGKGWVHFDIAMSKRELALQHGAIPITLRELAMKTMAWKKERRDAIALRRSAGIASGAREVDAGERPPADPCD